MKKMISVLALALAALLMMTGCSSGGDPAANASVKIAVTLPYVVEGAAEEFRLALEKGLPELNTEEKKILVQQALSEGKPADIVEKMVIGRLKKELKETCLVEQKFVKDNDLTVAQYVKNVAKEIGKEIEVVGMVRYEVGEGMEKRNDNFAEEVMNQVKGA